VIYAHHFPSKWEVGPEGKKCIFICYLSHSKGYVFLGEHEDGSVTEIES